MIMVNLIQGYCGGKVMECSELPHSRVLEGFIKVKLGYAFLREVVANITHWLDCRITKWNLVGKCSNQ